MQWRRLTWRVLATIVAVAVCFVLGAIGYLVSAPGRRWTLEQLERILVSQGIGFKAREMRYRMWPPRVILEEVEVWALASQANRAAPFLTAARLESDLHWRIGEVLIVSPKVAVLVRKDGETNLPKLPEGGSGGGSAPPITVELIRVTDGSLSVQDQSHDFSVELNRWQTNARLQPSGAYRLEFTTSQPGRIAYEGRTESIDRIRLVYSGTAIQNAEIVSGLGRISATGTVQPNLNVNVQANIPEINRLVADVRGRASADIHVTGTLNKPLVSGDVSTAGLFYETYGPVDSSAHFTVNETMDRINIVGARAGWRGASITGEAELVQTGTSQARLRITGLETRHAEALLGEKIPVSTQLAGNVSASWPGFDGVQQAVGSATLQFTPTRTGDVPISGKLNVTANAGTVRAAIDSLGTGAATINGDLTLNRKSETLAGAVSLNVPDSGAVAAQLKQAGLVEGEVPAVKGAVTLQTTISGTISKPAAAFQLDSPALQLGEAPQLKLTARGEANPDLVRLETFEAAGGGTRVAVTGEANLAAAGTQLRFDGTLDRTPLSAFSPQVDGSVSGSFAVRGTAQQPEANAKISVEALQAYGEKLGNGQAAVTYGPAGLVIPRFELVKGDGSIVASGAGTGPFRANVEINNYAIDSLTLPSGETISGLINGEGNFEGASVETGTGALNLTVTNLAAAGRKPGQLDLSATLAQGAAKANLAVPAWGISSTAQASVQSPYPGSAEVTLKDFALNNVSEITGTVTGVAKATGEFANPESLKANAEISNLRVTSGEEAATNSGPIRASYADGVATIESLTITSGDSRVSAQGQVPVLKKEPASLTFDADIDVALAARLAKLDPSLEPAGRLRAKGTLAGTAPDLQPDVAAELTGGQFRAPGLNAPISNVQASVSVQQGQIRLSELSASLLGGTFTASGSAPMDLTEYTLRAEANGLRLEQVQSESPVAGVLNIRAEAQGKGTAVRDVNAKVEFPGLRIQMGELDLAAKSTPTITLQNGFAQINDFTLAGTGTQFQIRGGAALVDPYPLAVRVDGDLDAAIAGLFTNAVTTQGRVGLHVAVTGTGENPRLGGSVELSDVQATVPAANAVVENLNARVDMTGQQITISNATGNLNGGTLNAKGSVQLKDGAPADVNLEVESRNSAWNIPEGLETATNIDLRLAGPTPRQLTLSGNVRVLEGAYRERMVIERGLLNAIQPSAAASATQGDTFPIALDVAVRTVRPIVVENDLLNGALMADLRVRGNTQRPGLTGRVEVEEGGILYLTGRNYLIERAMATFTSERRIEPILDVLAQTKAGGREITLQVRGAVGEKLDTSFTSDDGLPEPDVISLLVTGRTLSEARGAELDIAGDQALSYLAGSVGGTISQSANRALGFNLVRIDPSLIAQEAEPTARLTLGQDVTEKFGLVYSVNLKNSSDQIWIGRYDVTRRFSSQVVRQSDASLRFQFQHDIEFGGTAPPSRRRGRSRDLRVGAVNITGTPPIPEKEIRDRLGLKAGKEYDFFKFRKGIDRIKESLRKEGFPEATIRSDRSTPADNKVNLSLAVEAGSAVQFVYEGSGIPGDVKKDVERAWARNSFDALRTRQATEVLKKHFADDGYYDATVETSVDANPNGGKRVLFEFNRGTKFDKFEFAFPGAAQENLEPLQALFEEEEARVEAILKPQTARDKVAQYYRSQGYLQVEVNNRAVEKPGGGVFRYQLPVTEGARYRIANVETAGSVEGVEGPKLEGQPFVPAEADRGTVSIEDALEAKGYTDVEANIEVARNDEAKTVDLTYRVIPGEKRVLSTVEVAGNQHTSVNLVRTQIGIKPGEPISPEKLSQARRNLYDTGAFISTDLELQPGDLGPGGLSTRLVARVREVRPYELRYGALYDTDNGPGGIFDFTMRNILGSARTLGFRGRYDGELNEARTYFEQPNLLRFPLRWVTTGFLRREINQNFLTDRTGGSTTIEYRWRKNYRFNAGYRFEQVHTFEKEPDPVFPFDIRVRNAPLTFGFQRDTRNDILDAMRGSYFSHIGEWSMGRLGSQLYYAKYFGQYFYYRPFLGERKFGNAPTRPGLVLAGSVRFGIASGTGGQELIPSERFFSGGATSVRGFEQDTLGALPGEEPLGGEGLWIANVEARIPLFKYADIVGFIDAGNVYRRWQDISLAGGRITGGLGLRVRTPFIMIRLDYGIKLNRRPGESLGRFHGGIGQAF